MSPDLRSHPGPRSAAKRERIVEAAMRAFAERGYQGARVEDIASELGIAKGSIFQHFGSKAGLFFAAYQRAVQALPSWLDAPAEIVDQGFWAVLVYWLERTEHLIRDDWIPYRVALVGNYGTDLELRHEINRYLVSEDPYGTLEFIELGVRRGDLRADLDVEMAASMLDWLASGFQDALVTKELDPGLFHRHPDPDRRRAMRIEQFVELLRRAIGAEGPDG
ncbi:MAG TPA: TetR/AcrR family transcriptional regulator [Actinomycetota bacterium]|jgi:AcrR family transcriptional regulator|nr:TetR/AcrR family transcriptional regulator [Actinomycetota bacterium]